MQLLLYNVKVWKIVNPWCKSTLIFLQCTTHLLKFLCNHGEGFEDDLRLSGNGDNALWTGTVRYINPGSTLDPQRKAEFLCCITFNWSASPLGWHLHPLAVKYHWTDREDNKMILLKLKMNSAVYFFIYMWPPRLIL